MRALRILNARINCLLLRDNPGGPHHSKMTRVRHLHRLGCRSILHATIKAKQSDDSGQVLCCRGTTSKALLTVDLAAPPRVRARLRPSPGLNQAESQHNRSAPRFQAHGSHHSPLASMNLTATAARTEVGGHSKHGMAQSHD